ncbi:MAG: type II toxin-antitoxin system RelE/ParE family toxin [Sulfitobacter sp.]|uniref:type II toxin-antitoxin system RelE/ParE family toxin n=1 Tax=Alphaproteobacteria TaxID=28211 RepID=UPI00329A7938|tara:strand:+ start:116 stop:466 length:351 start_codon:yes stop_codon:yes gene_type:complete
MVFDVVRGAHVDHDLDLIFDFLIRSAQEFGEDGQRAFNLGEQRVAEIEGAMRGLSGAPYQGTLRPHLGMSIRNVTKGRAVLYFDVDEHARRVRILAIFFGGQDHEAGILARLLSET